MGHRYDGSSIDLEKALTRYMIERRVSRRELLERIGQVGAAAALAPVIAACSGGASAAPSTAASAAPSSAGGSAAPSGAASPTPVPSPESDLYLYNWTEYLADDVVQSFEDTYGVNVKLDYFDNVDVQLARLGDDGGGFDLSFPISTDIPDLIAKGTIVQLDQSLLPNKVNLGAEWQDSAYDPGNAYSMPYVWWTTGVGYDPTRVEGTPTSSKLLWDTRYGEHILMLDDWQEVFGMTLLQLGFDANTSNTAELDQALAHLQVQKPLVRDFSTDTTTVLLDAGFWVGQMWGSDLYQITPERPDWAYFIPEEGGVRGSDTMAVMSGALHPIAAHLFINHVLDAHQSAANTNYIGYMGPNAAAKEFIDPAILADPAVNPDQATIDALVELIDLDQAVRDEYLTRWTTLLSG
jgi:spermidine/putrescine transport system substrate-binding protein